MSLAAFVLAAAIAAVPAPAPTPRQAVADVAEAIEKTYFDEAKARRIATALRAEAAAGRYDGQTPAQLATTLSTRLEKEDHHFRVAWRPAATAPAKDSGPPPSAYGPEEADRRGGYGYRQVAILSGNIGYIALDSFAPIDFADSDWPARATADAALQLVRRTDGLIIDLRDNGGGHPTMVGYLASAFVGPERDVYNVFHGRMLDQSERPEVAYKGKPLTMPLYILVSARTGSAAEAFAYTLQAAGRATIVGETSAGAANPGGMVDVPGGYSVFVSMGSPVNAITHANWEDVGVKPERPVAASAALDTAHVAALEGALAKVPAAERVDTELALEAARASGGPAQIGAYAGSYGPIRIALSGTTLQAIRGRRPALALAWIGGDTFFPVNQPSTRYRFERGADGTVARLIGTTVDGGSTEFDRDGVK